MILRKPYAFFIKHFRLIHFILSFLMLYCVYYSKRLLDFFNEYIVDSVNLKGQELVSIYAPGLYQIMPFLIIIVLGIILFVMFLKNKPKMLYIINIASCIFTAIVIQIGKTTLASLETSMMDARSIRLIRDITMLSFMIQIAGTVVVLIRSVGFDVKKFDFKQDLKELEVNEEDREEFELEFNFDKNKTRRNLRRRIRFLKYAYKENKLLAHIVMAAAAVVLVISGGVYYINIERPVTENIAVSNNGTSVKIKKSYITNTDYKGNIIDEDSIFIILQADIKANNTYVDYLDVATAKLSVGEYSYIPLYDYKEAFLDFGTVYLGDKLSTEYEKKIFVYQIPKQFKNKKIEFQLVDKTSMEEKVVKLNLKDLTTTQIEQKANLKEQLNLSDSILSKYALTINNYSIQSKYKLDYNYCYNKECFASVEYLVPSINTTIDKSILRLQGTLETEEVVSNITDLYDVISSFGTINYSINGNMKVNAISLSEIVSKKKKEDNVFYIEVPKEVEQADTISIKLKIRDKIYEYVLK